MLLVFTYRILTDTQHKPREYTILQRCDTQKVAMVQLNPMSTLELEQSVPKDQLKSDGLAKRVRLYVLDDRHKRTRQVCSHY